MENSSSRRVLRESTNIQNENYHDFLTAHLVKIHIKLGALKRVS